VGGQARRFGLLLKKVTILIVAVGGRLTVGRPPGRRVGPDIDLLLSLHSAGKGGGSQRKRENPGISGKTMHFTGQRLDTGHGANLPSR